MQTIYKKKSSLLLLEFTLKMGAASSSPMLVAIKQITRLHISQYNNLDSLLTATRT